MHATPASPRELSPTGLTVPALLDGLPGILFLVAFGGVFVGLALWAGFEEQELPGKLTGGLMALIGGVFFASMIRKVLTEYVRLWRIRLNYGHLRLRLPQVQLESGTPLQLELVVEREVPQMPRLQATLRFVREERQSRGSGKQRRTVTLRHVNYEHVQQLAFETVGPGHNLVIPLELPRGYGPEQAMDGRFRCFWELQLVSEGARVNLDAVFLLPVRDLMPAAHTRSAA